MDNKRVSRGVLSANFDSLFAGCAVYDRPRLEDKLGRIRAEGPSRLHCVLDFDHTITAGKEPGQNVGTWDFLDESIPADME